MGRTWNQLKAIAGIILLFAFIILGVWAYFDNKDAMKNVVANDCVHISTGRGGGFGARVVERQGDFLVVKFKPSSWYVYPTNNTFCEGIN